MKRLFLGIAAAALLLILAPPAMSQAPSRQQSPRIDMPDEPAASEATAAPARQRPRRKRGAGSTTGVDRSAANAFTHQLNRQVLQSLQSGGEAFPGGNPPRAYPPR